jgi:hypothetical protein
MMRGKEAIKWEKEQEEDQFSSEESAHKLDWSQDVIVPG